MKPIPDEKQIEEMLANSLPRISSRLDRRLSNAPWTERAVARRRFISAASLVVLLLALFIVASPQGRAFAQQVLSFFVRADQDRYPLQAWQLTPQTPPSAEWISPSQLSIQDAEARAGFEVIRLVDVPSGMKLIGILYDEKYHTVAQGFAYEDLYIELSLWQQPLEYYQSCGDISNYCDNLLGSNYVGASAYVETVQIGELTGEYLEGTWNLTDHGPVWEPTPFVKFLRWQTEDMTFELAAGIEFTKDELIALAVNIH